MEADEIWAYRETGKHPLVPVRFIRHRRNTNKRNAHSQIRFEDPDADGLEAWVPTGRLKCLWADAEAFRANELSWSAVLDASREREGVIMAIDEVVMALLPDENWGHDPRTSHRADDGIYPLRDIESLSKLTNLSVDELRGEPSAFELDGTWIVPVATALSVAERLAPLDPSAVLRGVERDERELAALEEDWRLRGPASGPDRQTEDHWEERRLSFALRRKWIGEESNSLRDQALAAQQESERLKGLVEWAIGKLDHYGHGPSSATLQRYLDGAPLPTYRRKPRD